MTFVPRKLKCLLHGGLAIVPTTNYEQEVTGLWNGAIV
jgi:hypothetical protein